MRDYRDAKVMAQSIRAGLADTGLKITISGSLELIAKAFGAPDWNTLSATIKAAEPDPEEVATPAGMGPVKFSGGLVAALHRATESAAARRHEYTTLEHLLLALTDDADAAAVMEACRADPRRLQTMLTEFIDVELDRGDFGEHPPTESFHRMIRRAVIHAQESGRRVLTGANVLVGIFTERESQAAQLLHQLGATYRDAVNFVVYGISKGDGPAEPFRTSRATS
jgi:hypothetical protein